MKKKLLATIATMMMIIAMVPGMVFADSVEDCPGSCEHEAAVGNIHYDTFEAAITAANGIDGGATVTLLKDVVQQKTLTISRNVMIIGEKRITRASTHTGNFFVVNSGATLTLDGGLVIDGGNNYTFNKVAFMKDCMDRTQISKEDSAKWFTPEAGAPVASAFMITTTGGTVNLNEVTIRNNYSSSSGVISAGTNSTITLTGAKISHVAATQGNGVVVNVSGANINVTVNEGTVIDGNHVGGNHGIFKIYSGAKVTMNGGKITNNTGWNSNGTVVGIYWGTFIMNGGEICSNAGVYGPNNGRNAAVYGHQGHVFTMNGGTICHNTGGAYGGLDAPFNNGATTITGGAIVDNVSASNGEYPDINGNSTLKITGGTFTQDVSQWIDPECGLVYDPTTGRLVEKKELELSKLPTDTNDKIVDTGDDANTALPFVIAGLALAVMAAVVATRRRTN